MLITILPKLLLRLCSYGRLRWVAIVFSSNNTDVFERVRVLFSRNTLMRILIIIIVPYLKEQEQQQQQQQQQQRWVRIDAR